MYWRSEEIFPWPHGGLRVSIHCPRCHSPPGHLATSICSFTQWMLGGYFCFVASVPSMFSWGILPSCFCCAFHVFLEDTSFLFLVCYPCFPGRYFLPVSAASSMFSWGSLLVSAVSSVFFWGILPTCCCCVFHVSFPYPPVCQFLCCVWLHFVTLHSLGIFVSY